MFRQVEKRMKLLVLVLPIYVGKVPEEVIQVNGYTKESSKSLV